MKQSLTKYAIIALLGLTGIISCSDDESGMPETKKATLKIDKESLAFGTVENNKTSELEFTVTNDGEETLKISSIVIEGANKTEFSVTTTQKTIAPGIKKTFKVVFKPTSIGDKKASLTVLSDIGNKTIALSGKSEAEDSGSTSNPFELDGFLFSYEFEDNLKPTLGKLQAPSLSKEENNLNYIEGISTNSKAININGSKLTASIPLKNRISEITISFWYKSSETNRTHLLKLNSELESMRVVKDTNKHFIDGRGYYNDKETTYNNSNHATKKSGWNHILVTFMYHNNSQKSLTNVYLNGERLSVEHNWSLGQFTIFEGDVNLNLEINPDKVDMQIDNLRIYDKGYYPEDTDILFKRL